MDLNKSFPQLVTALKTLKFNTAPFPNDYLENVSLLKCKSEANTTNDTTSTLN